MFNLMGQNVNLAHKWQLKMMVVFLPIFVAPLTATTAWQSFCRLGTTLNLAGGDYGYL